MIWIVWVLLYAHINSVGSDCYFHQRACQCSVEAWHQKLEVLVPSVVQIMKEDSSARVTSLFLTPHVVVIRSAYSCFSSKQINIYYSHSSVQLGGDSWQRSDCAALPHKGTLWETVLFSVTIIFTTLPVWDRGGSQRNPWWHCSRYQ